MSFATSRANRFRGAKAFFILNIREDYRRTFRRDQAGAAEADALCKVTITTLPLSRSLMVALRWSDETSSVAIGLSLSSGGLPSFSYQAGPLKWRAYHR